MNPERSTELARHFLQQVHDTAAQLIDDGVDKQDVAVALGVVSETLDEYRTRAVSLVMQEQVHRLFGITAADMFPMGGTVRQ